MSNRYQNDFKRQVGISGDSDDQSQVQSDTGEQNQGNDGFFNGSNDDSQFNNDTFFPEEGQPSFVTRSYVRETRTFETPEPKEEVSETSSSSSESVCEVEPANVVYLCGTQCPCSSQLVYQQPVTPVRLCEHTDTKRHSGHCDSKHHHKHSKKWSRNQRENQCEPNNRSSFDNCERGYNDHQSFDRSRTTGDVNDNDMTSWNNQVGRSSSYDPVMTNRREMNYRTTLRDYDGTAKKRSFMDKIKQKFS